MPNKRYNKQIFKMADGGSISPKDIEKMTEKAKPAVEQAFSILKKFKEKKDKKKQIKGDSGKQKKKAPFDAKDKPKSIREKIAPKKKMDRLKELKKELGMKKGGKAKFPDLTGDGKVTRADILKGRGVFRKGGASK